MEWNENGVCSASASDQRSRQRSNKTLSHRTRRKRCSTYDRPKRRSRQTMVVTFQLVQRSHSHDQQAVTNVTTMPSQAHTEALQQHEHTTRLTLAKYASNAAAAIHKSVHPAKYTKEAKDLASVMATVHRQDQHSGVNAFTLNVLNMGSMDVQVDDTHA